MVNICVLVEKSLNLEKKEIGFASSSPQANQASVSYNTLLKYGTTLAIFHETPIFNVPLGDEAVNNGKYFLDLGFFCRFNGFCMWLTNLDNWIFDTWKPHLSQYLNIFPMIRGVFLQNSLPIIGLRISSGIMGPVSRGMLMSSCHPSVGPSNCHPFSSIFLFLFPLF